MSLFPAQESDLERWDQLCGDGREDESKDGEVQYGGQIVKEENPSVSSSHGIFVPRLSSFNICLINFVKRGLKMYQTTSIFFFLKSYVSEGFRARLARPSLPTGN